MQCIKALLWKGLPKVVRVTVDPDSSLDSDIEALLGD